MCYCFCVHVNFLVENILYLLSTSLFIYSSLIIFIMYHLSYSICSDPDDVLKTKTFGGSSFYYPPIFLSFISGKIYF